MYVSTGKSRYLDLARNMADEAIDKLYLNGLFRGHPHKPYYEAVDGVGFLLYALLELEQVLKAPVDVLKNQKIIIGEGGVEIGLDNW